MKITDIQIDSFGHWLGLHLPDISPGVTVIYGPNEAGKSTILHLIRGIFYGYAPKQHARFIPPKHPGHVGGCLSVCGPHGQYRVRRWLPSGDPLRGRAGGDLEIRTRAGTVQGKHVLGTLLSGVDEEIFRNVFAVGLTEMQRLATLSDSEAAQQLYGLASGSDRVSLSDVTQQLGAARQQLLDENLPRSISHLVQTRDQLQREADTDRNLTERWLKLMKAKREVDHAISERQQRQKQFGQTLAETQRRATARAMFGKAKKLQHRLQQLQPMPEIPDEAVRRSKALQAQIRQSRKRWEKLRQQRRKLREEGQSLDVSTVLRHYGPDIMQLDQRAAWAGELVNQVAQFKARLEETEFELQGELERMGLLSGKQPDMLPVLTDQTVKQLRQPAAAVDEAEQQANAAEEAVDASRQELQQIERELAAPLRQIDETDLTTAWKKQEQRVERLRQRIQIDNELDTSHRKLKETRQEHHDWSHKELVPWRGLMVLGAVFSVGVALILVGAFGKLFNISDHQRMTVALIGGALSFAALAMRSLIEMAAGRSAAACEEEMNQLHGQIRLLREEAKRIDPQLPETTEPLVVQLQNAQEELESLAKLQPRERARRTAEQRLEHAEADRDEATERQRDAQRQWREVLRMLRLPESMTPGQLREIAQPGSVIAEVRSKRAECAAEYQAKQDELNSMTDCIQTIYQRSGIAPVGDGLEEQIAHLAQALKNTQDNHRRRESLRRKWRDLGRDQERIAQEAKKLQNRRQQLVVRYGAENAQELKETVKRRNLAVRLKRQRDKTLRDLADELGDCCSFASLRQHLKRGDFNKTFGRWEQDYDRLSQELNSLLERRGELGQQIKQLASQRQHLQKRVQLDECNTQLRHRTEQWQQFAATQLALDSVRKDYETDRQPETLAEASGYLQQLSDGRYSRIWTPCGESVLQVDDQSANPVRVEHLSRGTREQVFLALRMALAASYGRRGAAMPLILDDVLVNFDKHRAEAAAKTICEFASSGQQVLVFTCHEHIRNVFFDLQVDLRELPPADSIVESPRPVLPKRSIDPAVTTEVPRERRQPTTQPEGNGAQALTKPQTEAANTSSSQTESFRASPPNRMPTEDDPELDHELTYGAPQYDPGFGVPEPEWDREWDRLLNDPYDSTEGAAFPSHFTIRDNTVRNRTEVLASRDRAGMPRPGG